MEELRVIKLSEKKVSFKIVDEDDKELGVIKINPADMNLIERLNKGRSNIQELVKHATSISEDVEYEDAELVNNIIAIDEEIKSEFDKIFDYPVSAVLFGNAHCLSLHNGEFLIISILDDITAPITDVIKEESKKAKSKMDKYVPQDHKRTSK